MVMMIMIMVMDFIHGLSRFHSKELLTPDTA